MASSSGVRCVTKIFLFLTRACGGISTQSSRGDTGIAVAGDASESTGGERELTEKELRQYNPYKRYLERKEKELEDNESKECTVIAGKVKGSMSEFPYTEIRTSTLMEDPKEARAKGVKLIKIQSEIDETQNKIAEIEDFINNIQDPELKMIYEMRCYQEKSWQDIAAEIPIQDSRGNEIKSINRTTCYRKFKKYLQKCT